MTTTAFSWDVQSSEDDAVLVLHGDINSTAASGFEAAYAQIEGGTGSIVIDFSDTDFINSTGIALIVSLLAKARAAHRPVVARGLTDHYREIFDITRLSDFLTIEDPAQT